MPKANHVGADRDPIDGRTGFQCPRCGATCFCQVGPNLYHCFAEQGGCGRDCETPGVLWRLGPDGQPAEVELDHRFAMKLLFEISMHPRPAEAFDFVASKHFVGHNLRPAVRRRLEEINRLRDDATIPLDNSRSIVFTKGFVSVRVDTSAGDRTYPVIKRPFEILRRVLVDDVWLVMVRDLGGDFAGTRDEVLRRLEANAQILNHRDIRDVLNHLISACDNHAKGQYTYGVYRNGDEMSVPELFLPKDGAQRRAVDLLRPHLDVKPTPEDWNAYATLFGLYNRYEWAPAAAIAAISPFSPVLREQRIIMPGIMHLSAEHGVGKTRLAQAVTDKLWAMPVKSADDINKEFRFIAYLDAVAAPRTIDDAEKFKWDDFGGMIKQSFESGDSSSRGTKEQGMVEYKSLGSFVFTANHLPPLSGSILTRMLIVEYDETRARAPAAVRKVFADTFRQLKTLGPALARAGIEMTQGKPSNLLAEIERIQVELENRFQNWNDSRRSQVWAILYWGHMVWARASGGLVACPSFDEYVKDVVAVVEGMTSRATMDPVVMLRNFIQTWVSTKSRTTYEGGKEIQGEGVIIVPHVWEEGRIPGHLITKAFLALYNDANGRKLEAQIQDLPRLARLISKRYRLTMDTMLDRNGSVKRFTIQGGQQDRAVFVPSIDPDAIAQTALGANGHGGHDDGAPPSPSPPLVRVVLGAQERHQRVLNLIKAEARGEEGARRDVVLARAMEEGIAPEAFGASIMALKETGRVFCPSSDTLAPM